MDSAQTELCERTLEQLLPCSIHLAVHAEHRSPAVQQRQWVWDSITMLEDEPKVRFKPRSPAECTGQRHWVDKEVKSSDPGPEIKSHQNNWGQALRQKLLIHSQKLCRPSPVLLGTGRDIIICKKCVQENRWNRCQSHPNSNVRNQRTLWLGTKDNWKGQHCQLSLFAAAKRLIHEHKRCGWTSTQGGRLFRDVKQGHPTRDTEKICKCLLELITVQTPWDSL